jgi:hypothetical protein
MQHFSLRTSQHSVNSLSRRERVGVRVLTLPEASQTKARFVTVALTPTASRGAFRTATASDR